MFDNFLVPDLLPAAPELFLAFMALVILLVDLTVKDSRHKLTFVRTYAWKRNGVLCLPVRFL